MKITITHQINKNQRMILLIDINH